MWKWFVALALLLVVACSAVPAVDGFPVVQSQVGGHTLSCKGTRCCWPWDDNGKLVVCIEPLQGDYLGAGGVMITLRGRVP